MGFDNYKLKVQCFLSFNINLIIKCAFKYILKKVLGENKKISVQHKIYSDVYNSISVIRY